MITYLTKQAEQAQAKAESRKANRAFAEQTGAASPRCNSLAHQAQLNRLPTKQGLEWLAASGVALTAREQIIHNYHQGRTTA